MPGRTHSRLNRVLLPAVTALILASAGLVTTPRPAAAVHAVPWRFTSVTLNSSISGVFGAEPTRGWVLQCPAGYTAVAGGIVGGDATRGIRRLLEYPTPWDGTYHILAHNEAISGTTVKLAATCVWLDDVGDITTVSATFPRNSSGRAGGFLRCPEGTTVLSGGVDWSNFSVARNIDYSSPIADDGVHGSGWYVAGYNDVSGTVLGIELRCVSSSLAAAEYVEADDSTVASPNGVATAFCTYGYRLLTGGALPAGTLNPGASQGATSVSGPLDSRQWRAVNYLYGASGTTLRSIGLCVPASTPSVTYTQTPAALSTESSGTITFNASDVAGEALTLKCFLDTVQRQCASGVPFNYGPLLDGHHIFYAVPTNESGYYQSFPFAWDIDTTVPVISDHTASSAASVSGPFTITFSEPVQGVTKTSVMVHAETANVNVGGTIARPSSTTATWTPNAPLVPGERYRISLTSAIHDTAGNPLTATYFTIRTSTSVDNTSVALERYWDLDSRSIASGGSYITANVAGSRSDLTFTATAGQTVSVFGIRLPNGGNADVYLDGVKKATPSFYASTATRSRVYLSPALAAGTHTISIRPLGTKPAASSGSWVSIDNVNFGATVKQESSLRQTFRRVSSSSASGGSYDVAVHQADADSTPARFRVTLVGTGFALYATKTPTSGKARVYVDGALKATIDLKSASIVYNTVAYSTTFPLAQHVVRIEAVGTATGANSDVGVDRITIN
jgi:hypothetical protein